MTAIRVRGVLELYECRTEKLCAVMMRVLLGISLAQSTFSADSLTVLGQPPCAVACISINEQVKAWQTSQTLPAVPLLEGMGSAALTASVALLGKAAQISARDS